LPFGPFCRFPCISRRPSLFPLRSSLVSSPG
jgi:hypothetical protein